MSRAKQSRDNTLEATDWVKGYGVGYVRRDALGHDHPESWPMLWFKKFGTIDDFPYKEFDFPAPVTLEDLGKGNVVRAGCPNCGFY